MPVGGESTKACANYYKASSDYKIVSRKKIWGASWYILVFVFYHFHLSIISLWSVGKSEVPKFQNTIFKCRKTSVQSILSEYNGSKNMKPQDKNEPGGKIKFGGKIREESCFNRFGVTNIGRIFEFCNPCRLKISENEKKK